MVKALIVDDEKHVREAIKMLVEWKKFKIEKILEASDGINAIKVIEEEKPEIIFTDMMMPGKDGCELLAWIQSNSKESKTIVISGYDDFNYVRHTIKCGGIDYILKPIDPMQLNESVKKAVDSWVKEQEERVQSRKRNIQMNQIKPIYLNKTFSNMIYESIGANDIPSDVLEEFNLKREYTECRIAVLSIDKEDPVVTEKFKNQYDLLMYSLGNICNETLKVGNRGYAFRYWNGNDIIILIWNELDSVDSILNRINMDLYQIFKKRYHFGVSKIHDFPMKMSSCYREGKSALKRYNLLDKGKYVHLFEKNSYNVVDMLSFKEYLENIQFAMVSGDRQRIEGLSNSLLKELSRQKNITIENLRFWWTEYTVIREHWVKYVFKDQIKELNRDKLNNNFYVPFNEAGEYSIELCIKRIINNILHIFDVINNNRNKCNGVIYEITQYIQNNYNKDINLNIISGMFSLSKEHISRKFKQEIGENISEYVNRIRIEKAKIILLNPKIRIKEVAEIVGYGDEKYFAKVFKKINGVSANEFRKQNC